MVVLVPGAQDTRIVISEVRTPKVKSTHFLVNGSLLMICRYAFLLVISLSLFSSLSRMNTLEEHGIGIRSANRPTLTGDLS